MDFIKTLVDFINKLIDAIKGFVFGLKLDSLSRFLG